MMLFFKHALLGWLCAAAVHRVPRPSGLGGTRHPRPWPPDSRPPSSGLRLPPLLWSLVTAPVAAVFQSLSLRQLCTAWRGGCPIAHSSRLLNRLWANSYHHPECGGRLKRRAPTSNRPHALSNRPRACARQVNRPLSINCGWLCVAGVPTPRAPTYQTGPRADTNRHLNCGERSKPRRCGRPNAQGSRYNDRM